MINSSYSFERRIQYVFLILLTGSILLGVVSVFAFSKITHTMNKLIYEQAQEVLGLKTLQVYLERKISFHRGYVITSDPDLRAAAKLEHNSFLTAAQDFRSRFSSKSAMEALNQISSLEAEHEIMVELLAKMKASGRNQGLIREYWRNNQLPLSIHIQDLLKQAIRSEQLDLNRALRQSRDEEREVLLIISGSIVAALLFGMGLFWMITQTVTEMGFLFREREKNEIHLKKALKEASDFKFSLEKASIFATTDVEGVITYVNDLFCKISKYSREELVGQTHRIMNSGHHSREFFEDLWTTIKAGKIWRGEIKNRAKDGTMFWVETSIIPFLDSSGKPYQFTEIRNDITYRKIAEERIHMAQHQLQAIMDNASSVIFLKNLQGEILFINRHFELLFGIPRGKLVGSNIHGVLPTNLSKTLTHLDEMVLKRGESVKSEEKIFIDGKLKTFHNISFPLKDSDGRIYAIGGMLTDISDKQAAEDNLKKALDVRDEFISVASHELKTPLSSLKLQAQMLKRSIVKGETDALDPETLTEVCDQTDRHVGRLVRLVDDMLDITRIRSGKLAITQEMVNLKELVLECLDRLKPQLDENNISLNLYLQDNVIGYWDRTRIAQVIDNLLTNAMKYGEHRPIDISLAQDEKGLAHLSITDHGIGISMDSHERIFNRFERAISHNEVSGLGLGLFITKELVRAHHGTIAVESAIGKGSTFRVDLPTQVSQGLLS